MDKLPFDDIEELGSILQSVFSGNQATIKQANLTLSTMSRSPKQFVDSLMQIIVVEKSDPTINKIKRLVPVILVRIVGTYFDKKAQNENIQAIRTQIMEAVVKAVYSPNVYPTLKAAFQQFLSMAYDADKNGQLKQESLTLAHEKLKTGNLNDFAASLVIMHAVINSHLNSQKTIAEWFGSLYESLVSSGNAIIEGVGSEIFDIMKGEQNEQKFTNVFLGLEILKVWTMVIKDFLKHLGRNDPTGDKWNYIEVIVNRQELANLLLKILLLQVPTENQIKECLFSTSGIENLDQIINIVKNGALGCFGSVIDFVCEAVSLQLPKHSSVLNPEYNVFYALIQKSLVTAIFKSLYQYCRSSYTNVLEGLNGKEFHECLNTCLYILIRLSSAPELYQLFSDYQNTLFVDICFPLIGSTKDELLMFTEDPMNFIVLTAGLDGDNENKGAKLLALALVKSICENIDGALKSLILIVGSMIEYSLLTDSIESIDKQFPNLVNHKESLIITSIKANVRVEACLLILTAIRGITEDRDDLLEIIEAVFTTYQGYFLGADTDPLIKSRTCLFLGTSAIILLKIKDNKNNFNQYIKFIVECAGSDEGSHQAVTEQANETLLEMFSDRELLIQIYKIVPEILQKLATYIPNSKSSSFFEVLHELIRMFHSIISKTENFIADIVALLVQRAVSDYETILKRIGLSKLILSKIWNILKVISETKSYIIPCRDQIEKAMTPLFTYLAGDHDVPFDSDILHFIDSTVKLTKTVSPITWDVLSTFPKILKRYDGLLTSFFPALNKIIVYGHSTIEGNDELIRMLADMGITGLNASHSDVDEASVSISALLFHILIQYVGIPNDLWEKMLITCLEKAQESQKNFVKARLGGVFLLAFLRNFEITEAVLANQNSFEMVMELFINQPVAFNGHPYDRKVFLISLSNFLVQTNAGTVVKEKLPQILDILVSYLKYIQFMEQNRGKILRRLDIDSDDEDDIESTRVRSHEVLKEFLGENAGLDPAVFGAFEREQDDDDDQDDDEDGDGDGDDDDENEDYDDDEEVLYLSEKEEANAYTTDMIAAIKSQDEFSVFREVIIEKLKQTNPQLLEALVATLPEKKKQAMKEVLQSHRIALDDKGKTQPRKLVKAVAKRIPANINNGGV